MSKNLKKLLTAIVFAVSVTAIFSITSAVHTPEAWQSKLQKNLYYEQTPSEEIVIVYIDEASLADDALGRWQDWGRDYYATAVENLSEASAIGIDILFNRKSEGISGDDLENAVMENPMIEDAFYEMASYLDEEHPSDILLAEAMEEAGNVVLIKYPYFDENGEMIYEVKSIDLISSAAKAEGYAYGEMSQSDLILKINAVESFDQAVIGETSDIPVDEDGEMYINYVGPKSSYDSYSFADIYAGNFEGLEDKIVLIGVGTPTLQDHYSVPLGDSNMYGVEIHANAIQTILDGNFLRDVTTGERIAILAILAALATAAFMYLNIWGGLAIFIALAIAYWISAKFAFRSGLILDLIYPFLALATLYVSTTLYRYFTEIQEKKQIKGAFGHYVSKEVVEEIAKNPGALKLGGEKREVTAFFADIASFTTWSEGTEPEALVAQLNEYFSMISEIIMQNQGTVDKFEGDAIMAFWGAPLPLPNHAELACKAALECRYALEDLNKKWESEGKRKINIRVGINSGEAIIGNIGSKERFDYTAIGDTINLAARLESANKFYATQIMISEKSLTEGFETRRLDRVRVKGKTEPIDIYELLAEKGKLPEKALALVGEFHQAIEYYRNGKFAEAKERFEKLLAEVGHDGPTKTYIARIEKLIANPPEGWDGTWTFDSK